MKDKIDKLRLLLFEDCNRNCPDCCNKDFDLKRLPICRSFKGYRTIILTGGEPMLNPELIIDVIKQIKESTFCKIILYTADVSNFDKAFNIFMIVDGMTLTLHEQSDVKPWHDFSLRTGLLRTKKNMRLNVFHNVDVSEYDTFGWKVKDNIHWIKNCPLPNGEVFMRLSLQEVKE